MESNECTWWYCLCHEHRALIFRFPWNSSANCFDWVFHIKKPIYFKKGKKEEQWKDFLFELKNIRRSVRSAWLQTTLKSSNHTQWRPVLWSYKLCLAAFSRDANGSLRIQKTLAENGKRELQKVSFNGKRISLSLKGSSGWNSPGKNIGRGHCFPGHLPDPIEPVSSTLWAGSLPAELPESLFLEGSHSHLRAPKSLQLRVTESKYNFKSSQKQNYVT